MNNEERCPLCKSIVQSGVCSNSYCDYVDTAEVCPRCYLGVGHSIVAVCEEDDCYYRLDSTPVVKNDE